MYIYYYILTMYILKYIHYIVLVRPKLALNTCLFSCSRVTVQRCPGEL